MLDINQLQSASHQLLQWQVWRLLIKWSWKVVECNEMELSKQHPTSCLSGGDSLASMSSDSMLHLLSRVMVCGYLWLLGGICVTNCSQKKSNQSKQKNIQDNLEALNVKSKGNQEWNNLICMRDEIENRINYGCHYYVLLNLRLCSQFLKS